MNQKKVIITGIAGQDGSYLAELLIKKGYRVFGTTRRDLKDTDENFTNISHLTSKVKIIRVNLVVPDEVNEMIKVIMPDEIYHLAGQSCPGNSFKDEFTTMNSNIHGTHLLLSGVKEFAPKCRFFFAGSAEMFSMSEEIPQTEKTPPSPSSPYGISKNTSSDLVRYYRRVHNIHASTGILFNHESPRRGHNFVTRKISRTVARIKLGLDDCLELGNIEAKRDWGYAPEYVYGMWLMLQQDKGDDFVLASGVAHTVRDFVESAFKAINMEIEWHGPKGTIEEYATHKETGKTVVKINPDFFRPVDIKILLGDASKARTKLKWTSPTTFEELIAKMVKEDLIAEN